MYVPRLLRLLLLAALIAVVPACGGPPRPYQADQKAIRDPDKARELTERAVRVIHKDPERAEKLLRQALGYDLYHGPAHNNLGILLLERGELYKAVEEFEWARQLMPGHPDPRLNLGIALERAGRIDDALDAYESSLEAYPGYLPTVQSLARCRIINGRKADNTRALLREIALRGETEEWKEWARRELTLVND